MLMSFASAEEYEVLNSVILQLFKLLELQLLS